LVFQIKVQDSRDGGNNNERGVDAQGSSDSDSGASGDPAVSEHDKNEQVISDYRDEVKASIDQFEADIPKTETTGADFRGRLYRHLARAPQETPRAPDNVSPRTFRGP
jgi:hypothetical protein